MKSRWQRWAFGTAVALVVGGSLAPFAWFVLTSLKHPLGVTAIPPELWPAASIASYRSAVERYDLLHFLWNSFLVAGSTTIITMLLSTLAAYPLARLRVPFRNGVLLSLLLVSMFPQISIAGPVWKILDRLDLLNSLQGIVIPYVTLTLPLGVWIMTSFFRQLPRDLEDAARVDGWGQLQTLFRVFVPLSAPGVFTAAILVFIYAWNEFFFALLILTEREVQTLPVGIALFQGEYTLPWGEIAAASTVATVPLVLLVLFFQRRIVSGLAAGAIKG